MSNVLNNPRFVELKEAVGVLKKAFFLFVFFLLCVKGGECLIKWNSVGEFLLSLSVGVTGMVAILACFYGNKKQEHESHN